MLVSGPVDEEKTERPFLIYLLYYTHTRTCIDWFWKCDCRISRGIRGFVRRIEHESRSVVCVQLPYCFASGFLSFSQESERRREEREISKVNAIKNRERKSDRTKAEKHDQE